MYVLTAAYKITFIKRFTEYLDEKKKWYIHYVMLVCTQFSLHFCSNSTQSVDRLTGNFLDFFKHLVEDLLFLTKQIFRQKFEQSLSLAFMSTQFIKPLLGLSILRPFWLPGNSPPGFETFDLHFRTKSLSKTGDSFLRFLKITCTAYIVP